MLTEVRGALAKQYEALFSYSGVEIRFTTKALREICALAQKRGGGARALRSVMVRSRLQSLSQDLTSSHYRKHYFLTRCMNARARWVIGSFSLLQLLTPAFLSSQSVRYVLIDQAVVRGENRAHYWSRSEGAAFYSLLAAEEELDAREQAELEPAPVEEEAVAAVSEEPVEEPVKRRASGGSSFP